MEIELKGKIKKSYTLHDIAPGNCFKWGYRVYLRLSGYVKNKIDGRSLTAVALDNGDLFCVDLTESVTPVYFNEIIAYEND